MKNLFLRLLFVSVFITVFQTCNEPYDPSLEPLQWDQAPGLTIAIEKIKSVMDIQDKVTEALFRNPEVVGTGTGLDEKGNPVIVVYTLSDVEQIANLPLENIGRGNKPTALPASIENIKVVPKVTGMFKAYADADPTARFDRPVPIGVSTGHPDITAGTIGCRVKDSQGNVYALSNNHVYANCNEASVGDNVLQPGSYDGGSDPQDAIGTLFDFQAINFTGGDNKMDAAIAACLGTLGTATPLNAGYGTPGTSPFEATPGLKVQKYGRTTEWTHGEVSEVNVTVNVCYETRGPFKCVKSAIFIDQIAITPGTFSDGGDSGSLIVTDDEAGNNDPVGLLFAGSDVRTLANPIGIVLDRFNVTIDDGSGVTVNAPPAAAFNYTANGLTVSFADQSTDSDGSVVAWSWDFGDGTGAASQNPDHAYTSDGTYTVKLTVTDDDGDTGSASQEITVSEVITNAPPTAAFNYTANGLTVSFTDQSTDSDGSVVAWSWDFGDGTGAASQNPDHAYTSDGTYTVKLTVTDDDGATDNTTQSVTVSEQVAGLSIISIVPNKALSGSIVDVEITGTGFMPGLTVALENGDGPAPYVTINNVNTDGTTISATFTFKSGGPPKNRIWDVRVTNPDGSSAVLRDSFTVEP